MRKKTLATAFVINAVLSSVPALAASGFAGATHKGSLLIFPHVEALASADGATGISDTLISITNDSSRAVNLQCFWGTTEQQYNTTTPVGLGGNAAPNAKAKAARAAIRNSHFMAFSFVLTKNQPALFWAGDLPEIASDSPSAIKSLATLHATKTVPSLHDFQDGTIANRGELRCWAVNSAGDKEIHHNHLTGQATTYTFASDSTTDTPTVAGQAHQYNAWAFQAHYQGSNSIEHTGRPLTTPGKLYLDGKEYDKCPSLLAGQFIPTGKLSGENNNRTHISIANCHADLRQDSNAYVTQLTYTVYNANEVKFAGAHECMGAWYESDLGKTFPHFTYKTLKTDTAYFVVRPTSSRLCNQGSQKYALEKDIEASSLVGVQINDIGGQFQTSSNLIGLGGGNDKITPISGKILWDIGYGDIGKK